MSDNIRLDFGKLPLVEVNIRSTFSNPVEIQFDKINQLHNLIKDDFPQTTGLKQYVVAPGVSEEINIGPGQIHGVRFVGNKDGLVITFQNRIAVVEWIKQITDSSPKYPRYTTMKNTFNNFVNAIKQTYDIDSFPMSVVNMSYVNFLVVKDYKNFLDRYFSKKLNVPAIDGADELQKIELAWRKNGKDIRYNLEKVKANIGEGFVDGYRLTTVEGIYVSEHDGDVFDALNKIHSDLQIFFNEIISDHAKSEWQLKVVPNGS